MTIFAEFHAPRPRLPARWGIGAGRWASRKPAAGCWRRESGPAATADPVLKPWPLPLRIAIHVGGAGLPWLLLARAALSLRAGWG